jgi:hypothetical protein
MRTRTDGRAGAPERQHHGQAGARRRWTGRLDLAAGQPASHAPKGFFLQTDPSDMFGVTEGVEYILSDYIMT